MKHQHPGLIYSSELERKNRIPEIRGIGTIQRTIASRCIFCLVFLFVTPGRNPAPCWQIAVIREHLGQVQSDEIDCVTRVCASYRDLFEMHPRTLVSQFLRFGMNDLNPGTAHGCASMGRARVGACWPYGFSSLLHL